jgi:hypothetical protein
MVEAEREQLEIKLARADLKVQKLGDFFGMYNAAYFNQMSVDSFSYRHWDVSLCLGLTNLTTKASGLDSGGSGTIRSCNASTAAAARVSPFKALDLINARCLLMVRERPCSRIVIFSLSSAARSVARLRAPFGRPRGLPLLPLLN